MSDLLIQKSSVPKLPNRFIGKTYELKNVSEGATIARIKKIGQKNEKNQDELHEIAMECLELAFNPNHNNYDAATQFLQMIENTYSYSAARLQVKKWFTSFGPYRLVKKDGKEFFRKSNSEKAIPFNLQGAFENPWYTMGVRETQIAENIIDTLSCDTAIDKISRMLSWLNSEIKKVNDGKAKLDNPSLDTPVLRHIREALAGIEEGAKKERDSLKAAIFSPETQSESIAA